MLTGYSLWIVPEHDKQDYFQSIIDDIAKLTDSESFHPHVTLLGCIDDVYLEDVILHIKEGIKLPSLRLGMMHHNDYFFQSLFYSVVNNEVLTREHDNLANIVGRRESFFPHMSVHYGELEKNIKLDLIKKYCSKITSFKSSELQIVDTSRPVSEWKPIYKIPIF